ncbi:hypothetical protein [Kitasatospora sp. GP82]|uniref:effector-associated constant component EACC1 n=1 Tax=Kitasatospora sp. GP82 TaxID=3035089 RepID=UPI002473B1DF|nr:hypothetical protein [Kitasatospora sp. GP82]MDH6126044.1 hypothetical protein [Kitasatospora sp. GP82]
MSPIVIAFDADQETADEDARALQRKLDRDGELRGHVSNRIVPPRPGEQGGVADAVEIASVVGPLVIEPLCIWLTARLRKGKVAVELTRPDGTALKVEGEDTADTAELLNQVRDFLSAE